MDYQEKIKKLRKSWLRAKEESDKKIIEIQAQYLKLAQEKSAQNQYKMAKKIFKG